jgi:hypothetical protein
MTEPAHHDHGHDHGHGPAVPANPFPEAEWETLQKDDRQAAASVIGLMAGIFSIGLILYLVVALWVANSAT